MKIFVLHTVRENDAKDIVKLFKNECPNAVNIELHMVTPAVGAHIGCGVLGMGYYILEK